MEAEKKFELTKNHQEAIADWLMIRSQYKLASWCELRDDQALVWVFYEHKYEGQFGKQTNMEAYRLAYTGQMPDIKERERILHGLRTLFGREEK